MRLLSLIVLGSLGGFAATAHAQPVEPGAEVQRNGPTGIWSVGAATSFTTQASHIGMIGSTGLELDTGLHLGDRAYLGLSGQLDDFVVSNPAATNKPTLAIRAALEFRYVLSDTTKDPRIGWWSAPHTFWIGTRSGVESLDAKTAATFFDVELGRDWWIGRTGIGVFIRSGVTDQRSTAWGTTPADAMAAGAMAAGAMAMPAPPEISLSFSAGLRVSFD